MLKLKKPYAKQFNYKNSYVDLSSMQTAVASGSADEMFKLWNLFAVKTLTGNGVTCNWYTPGSGKRLIVFILIVTL